MPCGSTARDAELRSDEQRSLAHAADPARVARRLVRETHTVVGHDEHHATVGVGFERQRDATGARVPDHVGQALLGHAVDDQLLLGGEREIACESPLNLEVAGLRDARAQRQQRALEAELIERFRAQPPGDQPDLLRRLAGALAESDDIRSNFLGRTPRERLPAQDQPGEELADLVVQLACDAPALCLLGRQGPAAAVSPLTLEPVEHLVEGLRQCHHLLVTAGGIDPLTGSERVDLVHHVRERLQRRERAPQERAVDQQRHGEPMRMTANSAIAVGTDTVIGASTSTATARPTTPA